MEDVSTLASVGVPQREERCYRALLEEPGITAQEVSVMLDLDELGVARTLQTLEQKGLATRSAGESERFVPVPPVLALENLVIRREQELDDVRRIAQELETAYQGRRQRTSSAQLVEVLDSPEVVGQRALQLLRGTKREFLSLDKPPYTTTASDNDLEIQAALQRNVHVRAIYDRESLIGLQGLGLAAIRRFLEGGEEGRVFPQLPFKMNVSDRTTALLPLVFEGSGAVSGALVVHSVQMVESLALLWDILWDQALPIPTDADMSLLGDGSDWALSDEESGLVDLLLAGSKSETIAHQLGIGLSTVERRIRRLMRSLGAETRFQAGFQLARRLQA
jgi:sugar-specific transcriptional regulator TrmB/DNA-binding CsgD family transcriptional regulator